MKVIKYLAYISLVLGLSGAIFFSVKIFFDGYWIWGAETDFPVTGNVGNFIGGVVGTIFALVGTLFIILTFREQVRQSRRSVFESTFFEMIRLHRENVSDMRYTKYDPNTKEMRTAENRKVFRLIFSEFMECYEEVCRFPPFDENLILPAYAEKLRKIGKGDLTEMARIDIACSIVYFGVGKEGKGVLEEYWKQRYDSSYTETLLWYLIRKPKREGTHECNWYWEDLRIKYDGNPEEFYRTLNIRNNRIDKESESYSDNVEFYFKESYSRYYNGHQHRLSHYFRHLCQSYKYLSSQKDIPYEEQYFYGKMLRAQLSTYEQALLFVNSISGIGMRWELDGPEGLITKFNLVKNLPIYLLRGVNYKAYYPKVQYS